MSAERSRNQTVSSHQTEPSGQLQFVAKGLLYLASTVAAVSAIAIGGKAGAEWIERATEHRWDALDAVLGFTLLGAVAFALIALTIRAFPAPRYRTKDGTGTWSEAYHEARNFDRAELVLIRASAKYRTSGYALLAVGAALVFAGMWFSYAQTQDAVDQIAGNDHSSSLIFFYLVRTATVASIAGAFAWGTLNLGRASLDQATRYEKRLIAGHVLFELAERFMGHDERHAKLSDVMRAFDAWSGSVESAFTRVRFGTKQSGQVHLHIAKPRKRHSKHTKLVPGSASS